MIKHAYAHGQEYALIKLGILGRVLGGAAAGAGAGYLLSPYEREGRGALYGAALGGLGTGMGSKLLGALRPEGSLASKAFSATGAGLGGLGGIGLSQTLIKEMNPDTVEDPYHYVPR